MAWNNYLAMLVRCCSEHWALALEIAAQVAAGLVAVHKQKLVHRDIKPSNIMVSVEEGSTVTAKIIDLGLAKPTPDVRFAGAGCHSDQHPFLSLKNRLCDPVHRDLLVIARALTGDVIKRR